MKSLNKGGTFTSSLFNLAAVVSLTACFSVKAIDTRIDNVRLYQPLLKSFSQPSRLYIEEGKIIEVASLMQPKKPADKVIDAHSKYALPGFIDLHVHLGASGSNYAEFQYLPVESHFNSNLYLGVTTIVDLFSFDETLNEARGLALQQVTPNLFYAGTLFTNPGGHGTQFGGGALEVTSDDAIDGLWQQHMARNPNITKAIIETFGGHGESLTDNQLTELGKRSEVAGLPYFVHVSTLEDGKRAIKAGATALAHGINSESVDDEFIKLMVDNQVAYIPTLAVYFNHSDENKNQAISRQSALLKTVPEKLKSCLFDKVSAPSKWKDIAWQKRQIAYENIRKLHQAGIVIGTGSDAGNPYTLHGVGLHNEIQALKESGLSAAEVLNAATLNAAKIINNEQRLGQLISGFEASFILLNEDPLIDLSALDDIVEVYKSGQKVNRKQLITKNQSIEPKGVDCHIKAVTGEQVASVIDDFSGMTKWQAISDKMMGGQSTASIEQTTNILKISTSLGKTTAFGAWAGAHLLFQNAVDASQYQGVKIKYRGSNIAFGLSVYHSEVKDWDHFSTNVTASQQWQTLEIPFKRLKQFGYGSQLTWSAKSLSGLSFVWRTTPGGKSAENSNQLELAELTYF